MIVSHQHRFIFLKTKKTAGSSIEVALSKIAGQDAIVTPLHPPEDDHKPRNFAASKKTEINSDTVAAFRQMLRDASIHHDYKRYADDMPFVPYFDHMPAWIVRMKLGGELWDSYFKFCFERNPWDKVVSMYWYRHRHTPESVTFQDWLSKASRELSDFHIYSLRDEWAVDVVGRYENLSSDLANCLRRAGVGIGEVELPHAKSGFRRRDRLFSPEGVERVRCMFRREIEMFGYEFPTNLLADPIGTVS
jgi:Sulfotransferase family